MELFASCVPFIITQKSYTSTCTSLQCQVGMERQICGVYDQNIHAHGSCVLGKT